MRLVQHLVCMKVNSVRHRIEEAVAGGIPDMYAERFEGGKDCQYNVAMRGICGLIWPALAVRQTVDGLIPTEDSTGT